MLTIARPRLALAAFLALLLSAGGAVAQTNGTIDARSNGLDGSLIISADDCPDGTHEIDLAKALDRADVGQDVPWDTTEPRLDRTGEPDDGKVGVYDRNTWAVVYHYTQVQIAQECRVTFRNHPTRAPVVWLVQGDVTIDGTIDLSGEDGTETEYRLSEPGPGGFRGGRGDFADTDAGSGLGPGGGRWSWSDGNYAGGPYVNGSHGTPREYGNVRVLPLYGGSGGSGRNNHNNGAGAGGGALLIAADQTIRIGSHGFLKSWGGVGPKTDEGEGAGGAFRLIAHDIVIEEGVDSNGAIQAAYKDGAKGGYGRIRLEGVNIGETAGKVYPEPAKQPLDSGDEAVLWPEDLPETDPKPTARIVEIAGQPLNWDTGGTDSNYFEPGGNVGFGNADVTLPSPTTSSVQVIIETTDVPDTWVVLLRATTPTGGEHQEVEAEPDLVIDGRWIAELPELKDGDTVLQVYAEPAPSP